MGGRSTSTPAPPGHAADAADRRQRPAQPHRLPPGRRGLRAVADIAAEAGAMLLSDEVYRFLELDPACRLPAGADVGRHGVSIGVMSKSFALGACGSAGWRPRRPPARGDHPVQGLHDDLRIGPAEILALIAVRARDRVLARSLGIVESNLRPPRRVLRPPGGPLPGSGRGAAPSAFRELLAPVSIERFTDDLLQPEGVLLAPGSIFGHPGNRFRLGFAATTAAGSSGSRRTRAHAGRSWTPGSTSSIRRATSSPRP